MSAIVVLNKADFSALNIAEKIDVRRLIGQSRSGTRKFGRGKTMPDGRACRLYGNFIVNKVTANLHFTAAGHGYGWEHTDHASRSMMISISRSS